MAVWIKDTPAKGFPFSVLMGRMSQNVSDGYRHNYYLDLTDNKTFCGAFFRDKGFSAEGWADPAYVYGEDGWSLIAGTFNNDTGEITTYKDGVRVTSNIDTNRINALITCTTPTFVLGGWMLNGGSTGYELFEGKMDEAMLFSRCLEPWDIMDMYNMGKN
jgi:hypothetical protein